MRVLLCSRQATFAEVFEAWLEEAGHDVVTVSRLDRAVEDTARNDVDVCVIDLESPVGDVVGAVREITREGARVVALTDPAGDHLLDQRVFSAGAFACVSKAVGADAVLAYIDAAASGTAWLSGATRGRHQALVDRAASGDVHPALTARERQVLEGLARGESTAELAARLGVRPSTARKHVEHLLTKLGVHSRAAAVALAVRRGIIRP